MDAPPDSVPTDEHRIGYLATGFALGELDDSELQELYNALRTPGEHGTQAARIAWQVLGTTVDLRASLGNQFQDEIKHRLEHTDQAGKLDKAFVSGVMGRIGRTRKRLKEIIIPANNAKKTATPVFSLAVILVGIILLCLWIWSGKSAVAHVEHIQGYATIAGAPISTGDSLHTEALHIPGGSVVSLSWHDGSSIIAQGPSTVFPTGSKNISLTGGLIAAKTADSMTFGLPDAKIDTGAGTSLTILNTTDGTTVGVYKGEATVDRRQKSQTLQADQALAPMGQAFTWLHDQHATDKMPLHISIPEGCPTWTWSLHVQFKKASDRLVVSDATGQQLSLKPGDLSFNSKDASKSLATLNGPPLQDYHLTWQGSTTDGHMISLTGWGSEKAGPTLTPPLNVRWSADTIVRASHLQTGPPKIKSIKGR